MDKLKNQQKEGKLVLIFFLLINASRKAARSRKKGLTVVIEIRNYNPRNKGILMKIIRALVVGQVSIILVLNLKKLTRKSKTDLI